MRVVFMGTPDFALPCLREVSQSQQVVGVYTQPDRPKGRGLAMIPPPVKALALELGLPVFQPPRLRSAEVLDHLASLEPDVIIVVAYAQLLSQQVLNLPRYGCINVHASLLPAYRGGAPIQWAVVRGEQETGITTMQMSRGLDEGDMLVQVKTAVDPDETAGELHDRLSLLGAEALRETLNRLAAGGLVPVPQPSEGVSYARNLRKEDGLIDWQASAQALHNQVRGLNPWPVAYTEHDGKRLRIWQTKVLHDFPSAAEGTPGQVMAVTDEGLVVQTGAGLLLLTRVQPENKRVMGSKEYAHGRQLRPGALLG